MNQQKRAERAQVALSIVSKQLDNLLGITDEQCDRLLSIPAWYEGDGRESERRDELRAQLRVLADQPQERK